MLLQTAPSKETPITLESAAVYTDRPLSITFFPVRPKSKLDDTIALDAARLLHNAMGDLRSLYNIASYISPDCQYKSCVEHTLTAPLDTDILVVLRAKCVSDTNLRWGIHSSIYDRSTFAGTLFERLEFYAADRNPYWVTTAHVAEYRLVKHGVSPIVINLGRYETVAQAKAIREDLHKLSTAFSSAVAFHLGGEQP